jgi:PIN domain nuclease of toxin-antitoxin system
MKYLLDTHVWIWWNMEPQKLSRKVRAVLDDPDHYSEVLLSAISLWEFCKLIEKERIGISCNPEEWMAEALRMSKLRVVHLTPAIVHRSTTLPQSFHGDPADQLIVATAREENATILTKDQLMRDYKHVRTIW